ncbi:MAG: hypothetical protein K2Z81_10655 [Cyanobacteria bacterium]|nr:hypothetical protein [Cyanobacteriota bacterium]
MASRLGQMVKEFRTLFISLTMIAVSSGCACFAADTMYTQWAKALQYKDDPHNDARKKLSLSLSVLQQAEKLGKDHPFYIATLEDCSDLAFANRHFPLSRRLSEKELLMMKPYGPNYQGRVVVLYRLGQIAVLEGDAKKARQLLSEALEVRRKDPLSVDFTDYRILVWMGAAEFLAGHEKQGIETLDFAKEQLLKRPDRQRDVMETISVLGDLNNWWESNPKTQAARGKTMELLAVGWLTKAPRPQDDFVIAELHARLADAYFHQQSYKVAMENYEKVIKICLPLSHGSGPETIKFREFILFSLERLFATAETMKDAPLAKSYRAKADAVKAGDYSNLQ